MNKRTRPVSAAPVLRSTPPGGLGLRASEAVSGAEGDTQFAEHISALTAIFVPGGEEEDWDWWPTGHDFYAEWEAGTLAEILFDTALSSPVRDLPSETLEQAVAIGRQGKDILARCETLERRLLFRLLVSPLEEETLYWFEDLVDVLIGSIELGALLGEGAPRAQAEAAADELYGASDEWGTALAFSFVGFKLRLLGPEFQAAMQKWYDQLLTRAKAHYLHDQVVP